MKNACTLLAIVVVLAHAAVASSLDLLQNRQALEERCTEWKGQVPSCTHLSVGERVFIPTDWTFEELQAELEQTINVIGVLPEVSSSCVNSALDMACTSFLRPCMTAEDGNLYEVPVQPCLSGCFTYLNVCITVAEVYGLPVGAGIYEPPGFRWVDRPLQCNETDLDAANTSLFQTPVYSFRTEDGLELEVECRSLSQAALRCVPPLERDPATDRCAFVCPIPSYTDKEYDSAKAMQLTMGWLSWVGSLSVVLTYTIDDKLRKFPSNLVMMVTIAAHVASGAIILPSFGGHEAIWCGVDDQYLQPTLSVAKGSSYTFEVHYSIGDLQAHNPLCTLQGFILQLAYIATTCWWTILSFTMALNLYAPNSKFTKMKWFNTSQQVLYHGVAWGLSFLLALIPSVSGKVSFQAGATFCFISPEDENVWQIVFWFLPVGVMMVLGLFFFVLSLIKILRITVQSSRKKKIFHAYFRLLIFIFIFLLIYTFIFSYTLFLSTKQEDVEDEYSKYFMCLGLGTTSASSCNLSNEVVQYNLVMLQGFGYSSLGVFLWLNFFPARRTLTIWRRFFIRLLRRGGLDISLSATTLSNSQHPQNKISKISNSNPNLTCSGREGEHCTEGKESFEMGEAS